MVRQQTQVINALRAHMSGFGIVAAIGASKASALIAIVRDETDSRLPKAAHFALAEIANQIDALTRQIEKLEREIVAEAKRDEDMRRLVTIPGVGAITAASMKTLVPDPYGFTENQAVKAVGSENRLRSIDGEKNING